MNLHPDFWKKCNVCKADIRYGAQYWVCNVSTCNRKRTGMAFCSVACWDGHVPVLRHRESWAIEQRAPSFEEWKKTLEDEEKGISRERKPRVKQEDTPVATPSRKVILRKSG